MTLDDQACFGTNEGLSLEGWTGQIVAQPCSYNACHSTDLDMRYTCS